MKVTVGGQVYENIAEARLEITPQAMPGGPQEATGVIELIPTTAVVVEPDPSASTTPPGTGTGTGTSAPASS